MDGNNSRDLDQVLRYIEGHLEAEAEMPPEKPLGRSSEAEAKDPLTTRQLAAVAGYSEYHFIRLFRQQMGMTVQAYVIRRKLIRASEDIAEGCKVIDAAIKYGWESHSGFTRAFKREFGFSPSLLRVMYVEIKRLGGRGMEHVFLETTKVGMTKEALLDILLGKVEENGIDLDQETLKAVYAGACMAYAGVKRRSGEEYVTHPLNVAILLAELGAEPETICAGLYCDVEKKGILSMEGLKGTLQNVLAPDVFSLIESVNGADGASLGEMAAMDERIILIKLAERLHNMRTIGFIETDRRAERAQETINLFLPLARKVENQKLFDELNDLSRRLV